MSESATPSRLATGDRPLRGVVGILLTGVLLGAAYNWMGQNSRAPWGLSWIAEDRLATLTTLGGPLSQPPAADGNPYGGDSDDPMAIPPSAPGSGLPEIPELDRPVQIELPALKQLFDAGALVIVDARESGEYAAGHIPGAVNLPFDEAITDPTRLEALRAGKPIVTYCGGGSCEQSLNLADELVQIGHRKVLVYMGGFPQWEAAGYPVQQGSDAG